VEEEKKQKSYTRNTSNLQTVKHKNWTFRTRKSRSAELMLFEYNFAK